MVVCAAALPVAPIADMAQVQDMAQVPDEGTPANDLVDAPLPSAGNVLSRSLRVSADARVRGGRHP